VCVLIASDMLRETVHKEQDGLRERCRVGACIELMAVIAGQPLLDVVRRSRHHVSRELSEDEGQSEPVSESGTVRLKWPGHAMIFRDDRG
jgi:hypothetical protein